MLLLSLVFQDWAGIDNLIRSLEVFSPLFAQVLFPEERSFLLFLELFLELNQTQTMRGQIEVMNSL